MLVPKLRFKDFTDEWKYDHLSTLSLLIKDGTHGTHCNVEDGIPLLSAKDINNGSIIISDDSRKISISDFTSIYKSYKLERNDILLTIVGSIGRTAIYQNELVAFQRSVAVIRPNVKLYYLYLNYLLGSKNIINQIKKETNISAQGGIYLSSLNRLKCSYTSIEEQTKIANFLSLLDKKIQLQHEKIDALKLYKSYNLNLLFKESTVRKKIKDLGKVITGTTPSKANNEYWENGDILWITPTDINENKYVNISNEKLTLKGLKAGRFIPKKSLLVTCIASIGKNAIIGENGSCNQQINAIVPNDNTNTDYLYYLLCYNKNYMQSLAGQTATAIINKNTFENMAVNVHGYNKQKYIGEILSKFDIKIDLEKEKLADLVYLKIGLIQQLFI